MNNAYTQLKVYWISRCLDSFKNKDLKASEVLRFPLPSTNKATLDTSACYKGEEFENV
jgi:hypothetical protein